ncbi:auxilin-like protein 1 [Phtheirospermum japonicum]|uniref:Auxilin-like protein 1 n=1 Tax=Phtheirospermum japonicum TaxID=374723 RepID=A0A830BED9_9LAMI|nr:auxilin-like protein 1 [Phtheirospermum japonicum]
MPWLRKTGEIFLHKEKGKKEIELQKLWMLKSRDGQVEKRQIFGHCFQLCNIFLGLIVDGSQFHLLKL